MSRITDVKAFFSSWRWKQSDLSAIRRMRLKFFFILLSISRCCSWNSTTFFLMKTASNWWYRSQKFSYWECISLVSNNLNVLTLCKKNLTSAHKSHQKFSLWHTLKVHERAISRKKGMKYDLVMILRFVEKEKSLTLLQKTYNVTNDAPPLMKLKIAQNFRKATYKPLSDPSS